MINYKHVKIDIEILFFSKLFLKRSYKTNVMAIIETLYILTKLKFNMSRVWDFLLNHKLSISGTFTLYWLKF